MSLCVYMCSGAVALDGRIEPGDMILEVNGVSFENLSNDEAVRILRDVVQKSGSVNNLQLFTQLSHSSYQTMGHLKTKTRLSA